MKRIRSCSCPNAFNSKSKPGVCVDEYENTDHNNYSFVISNQDEGPNQCVGNCDPKVAPKQQGSPAESLDRPHCHKK